MADLTVENETDVLLCMLEQNAIQDSVVRANAMMAAAVSYLVRVAGHELVAAQLRADAATVEGFAPMAGATLTLSSAGLH